MFRTDSVVSVARMLLQGYKVEVEKDNSMMKAPHGQEMKVARHGSLLFLCPSVCDFDPQRFTDVCNHCHPYFQDEKSRNDVVVAPLQPGFKAPVYYHADKCDLQENFVVRIHKRARKTFFSPHGTQDRPLKLEDLADERETHFQHEDGTTEVVKDSWRASSNPTAKTPKAFVGKTVFKLQSKPTGKKLVGKQSALPEVQMADRKSETPTQYLARVTSKVQRPRLANLATPETQENLRQLVWNFGGADKDLSEAPEASKQAVLKQLALPDPMTGQPYVHDVWVELPLYWVRIHYMSRTKMFVPLEHELPGLGVSNERRTIIVDPDTGLAPIYTWLIRHAQWLMNRYLQKADGLTAYEKRWNKRYSGSLCNFGEAVHFEKPGIPKANPSFTLGVWVGRCTESDVHFVADETGVYKTRSVRRPSPSLQMNTELFLSVHSTP